MKRSRVRRGGMVREMEAMSEVPKSMADHAGENVTAAIKKAQASVMRGQMAVKDTVRGAGKKAADTLRGLSYKLYNHATNLTRGVDKMVGGRKTRRIRRGKKSAKRAVRKSRRH